MISCRRLFSNSAIHLHENPLGLPRQKTVPPQIPRRTGPPAKRGIPNVKKVLAVASGKGGVGKSTVTVNLAFALAMLPSRLRVGILDLDIFGPSIPTLMGLVHAGEPHLTESGALLPVTNHGLSTMSMGYLLPKGIDTAVVWRGLMVQKAVQQLLFDVDWTGGSGGHGLDILVVDMPPGTGDVPLTLGQLVNVDGDKETDVKVGSVIVSTPQDVALTDVKKGISMFRKVSVPVTGLILNQSHFICGNCSTPHYLFGSPDRFHEAAKQMEVDVLAELPLVPGVSKDGDSGIPYALSGWNENEVGGKIWNEAMKGVAEKVWATLQRPPSHVTL
ncbi:P-loop containing nucleoside triphosphate hydrolase protein [Guyanagaster necrorhizus]|uniref:P-loop containing nucleoside triphosphate hydrolase protein n=1 Tax=Guyanagaster necrorhizus TaxID=856835 RepID=A0A9P7VGE5_9AGAR|nr:P-loop containing nucleoside triphosphate hydrolase protein [Guyanagaster necrorhizus MCA 3950]KAG7440503.1 P-loop containing nucleoside triphosphate hydrolase protein [Guyanagaster necrorhizus MCA 3950]